MTLSNTIKIPPGQEKFVLPSPPRFSAAASWMSVASLLLFAAVSGVAIMGLASQPRWATAPFWLTAFGSGLGFLYELWLIATNRPYQLFGTSNGRLIQLLRIANISPVFGSAYLVTCLLTYGESDASGWLVALTGLLAGSLLVLFVFQAPLHIGGGILTIGLVGQIVLVLSSSELQGGGWSRFWLCAAAALLFATTMIGSQTPQQSTVFHLVATLSASALYQGLLRELHENPRVATTGLVLPLLTSSIFGILLAFRWVPTTWARCRSFISDAVWPLFYLIIAGGLRIPRPERLGDLYRGHEDELKPLSVQPYYLAHPRNLTHAVAIPCLDEALTLKVHAFGFLTRLVKFVFAAASFVNRIFPFADIDVPIRNKPRMEPWSDGSQYWPRWLLKRIHIPRLGWFQIESGVRGPGFQATPMKAVEAYVEGQLLAFLVEYGVAGPFVEPVVENGKVRFLLDMSFLEKYETKPDYEPYGGRAWFEIDDTRKQVRVTQVQAPHSEAVLDVAPGDAVFRHAEDQILASIYYYIVSGKHLVEIHMGLNLIEVALLNSFDAKRMWSHPIRIALYPHLFAHELAEELTTQNLLEDGAVFPQIFATTNAALMRHLNDRFHEYQLARDEDFERRSAVLMTGRSELQLRDVLPNSSLNWELEYAEVWLDYARRLVDAVYAADEAVRHDDCIQLLFGNLSDLFAQPLPDRYGRFQSKAGLARFIADTMHHLIIRHEVYGTSGVRLALDPRINKVQVPKDGGTYAVDEWRSLACVAMATSRVRYTKLMDRFSQLFDDIQDHAVRKSFVAAHDKMQAALLNLEGRYRSDGVDNYECLRLLPSELDIGAGY